MDKFKLTEMGEEGIDYVVTHDSMIPQLSFHAVNGTCSFQTMRIKGCVSTRTLFLLIDSGSTQNFMNMK